MAKKGLAGVPIAPLIIIIIGIVVVLYILKNKNLFRFGAPATAGAAIGATVPGPNVYLVAGPITEPTGENSRTRCNTAGCGEGSGDNSYRDNVGFPCDKCARETTWFFVPGTASGEPCHDLSIKLGSHRDSGTTLISFRQIPLEGSGGQGGCKGPHGTNGGVSSPNNINSGSVDISNGSQKTGIKGVSWNVSGATDHHEIWFNADGTGAEWTMVAQFEGQSSGCTALACPVPVAGHPFSSYIVITVFFLA